MKAFLKSLLPLLEPIFKTAGHAALAIILTALVDKYAPKLELPAVGIATATAAARKSTIVK